MLVLILSACQSQNKSQHPKEPKFGNPSENMIIMLLGFRKRSLVFFCIRHLMLFPGLVAKNRLKEFIAKIGKGLENLLTAKITIGSNMMLFAQEAQYI